MTLLRWDQGRDTIDELLRDRHLDTVPANREHADLVLTQARRHVASAISLRETDLELAFSAAYDAARKALTAVLAIQGLRPTASGGHISVYRATLAQLDPPAGPMIKPFDWMRRTRNDNEYPSRDTPSLGRDEITEAIDAAEVIIGICAKSIDVLPPYRK